MSCCGSLIRPVYLKTSHEDNELQVEEAGGSVNASADSEKVVVANAPPKADAKVVTKVDSVKEL